MDNQVLISCYNHYLHRSINMKDLQLTVINNEFDGIRGEGGSMANGFTGG